MSDQTQIANRDALLKQLAMVAFLALAVGYYFRTMSYTAPRHVVVSELPLVSLDGIPMSPAVTEGRAVLLNFWAPWCGPCRSEMPALDRLQADNPGLIVIGVEDDPRVFDEAITYVSQSGLSYRMVRMTQPVQSTFGHVVSLPTSLFISRSGKVLHTVSGTIPEKLMQHYAKDALAAD